MSENRNKILKKLISIPSYYPNVAGIKECEQFIKEFLDQVGIQDARVENVDGNIIFSLKRKGVEETVAILLHYDTIPPFNPNDPAELALSKDGLNLHGLGVTSAKAAIASILTSLERNKKQIPTKNLKIIFSCDETTGSLNGTQNLVKNYLEKVFADMYWIPDCTDSYISIGTYHVIPMHIRLEGVGGHPAYQIIPGDKNVLFATTHLLESVTKDFKHIESLYAEKNLKPILSITGVKFFQQPNIIAKDADIYLDLRFPPDEMNVHNLVEPLITNIKTNPLFAYLDTDHYHGFLSEFSSDIVGDFIDTAQGIMGKKIDTKVELGSHDGAFYGYKLQRPVLGFLPGGKNLHTKDESLPEGHLDAIEKIFDKFIYGI